MNILKKATFSLFLLSLSQSIYAELIDKTIAIVVDEAITQNEWQLEFLSIQKDFKQRGKVLPDNSAIRQQVLEKLILRSIILQEAKNKNISIAERQVQAAIKRIATNNKLSLEQFRKALVSQGVSYDEFYQDIRNELTIQHLQQKESNRLVDVSEQEIEAALAQAGLSDNQEYHTAHILLPVPEAATPNQVSEQLEQIKGIKNQLTEGANFNQLAQQHSSGQNALEGGDLGWRKQHELPSLFAETVSDLQAGEYSQVIRSPSGFHILYLIEQRAANQVKISQTQARHILIRPDAIQTEKDVIDKLTSLRDRIQQGDDFATIARANSIDHVSASQGGDLGWLEKGETVPAFEQVMNNIEQNQISEPFKSQFGWHILEVISRRDINSTDSAQHDKIKQQLIQRKKQEAVELWQKRLRDQAYVKLL